MFFEILENSNFGWFHLTFHSIWERWESWGLWCIFIFSSTLSPPATQIPIHPSAVFDGDCWQGKLELWNFFAANFFGFEVFEITRHRWNWQWWWRGCNWKKLHICISLHICVGPNFPFHPYPPAPHSSQPHPHKIQSNLLQLQQTGGTLQGLTSMYFSLLPSLSWSFIQLWLHAIVFFWIKYSKMFRNIILF